MILILNPYFQKIPLVVTKFISKSLPYSLIFKDFIYIFCPENKGIRVGLVDVILATKGPLNNKVFVT